MELYLKLIDVLFPVFFIIGIGYYIGKKDPVPILLKGLRRIEYRGYDSAGVALLNSEKLQIIKKLVNLETNLKNALQKERQEFYKLLDSKNKKIGIKSFILKKIPVWD